MTSSPIASAQTDDLADPANPSFGSVRSPFYWLVRVVHQYSHQMDAVLKRAGMDLPRWRVLMILTEIEPASVSQLAQHGVIKLSTMTKTVQRLELDGLVKTNPRESDGRVTEVRLTAAGRDAVARVRAPTSRIFRQAFGDIAPAEVRDLNRVLERMFASMGEMPRL